MKIIKETVEEKRRTEAFMKIRHKCDCGHTVYIPEYKEQVICDNCWGTVYKNKQSEFKDKLIREKAKAEMKVRLKK